MRCGLQQFKIVDFFHASNRDVFAGSHLIAHEILENNAHLAMQILQVVLAKIDAVEQDLPSRGVVEPRHQLHDCGFALAVFADQRQTLSRPQLKINLVENHGANSPDN